MMIWSVVTEAFGVMSNHFQYEMIHWRLLSCFSRLSSVVYTQLQRSKSSS